MKLTVTWYLRGEPITSSWSWPVPDEQGLKEALDRLREAVSRGCSVEFKVGETNVQN